MWVRIFDVLNDWRSDIRRSTVTIKWISHQHTAMCTSEIKNLTESNHSNVKQDANSAIHELWHGFKLHMWTYFHLCPCKKHALPSVSFHNTHKYLTEICAHYLYWISPKWDKYRQKFIYYPKKSMDSIRSLFTKLTRTW